MHVIFLGQKFALEDDIGPMPARLKLLHACDQWLSSRVSGSHCKLRPNAEGGRMPCLAGIPSFYRRPMNHVATLKANSHELCGHPLMTSHNTMHHVATLQAY
jgi:hypothetical protein